MMNEIKNIIEAILFVSGDPVNLKKLSIAFNIGIEELRQVIEELILERFDSNRGIQIKLFDEEVLFVTNEKYYDNIANFFNYDKSKNLSNAALEVISIVAYKQPVTKAEIDNIRGVKSDYIISKLLNDGFIYISDKLDAPGLPNLYSTTTKFLRKFNLNSIDELPKVDKEEVEI